MPRTRGGEISRAPFRLEPEDSRNNRGLGTYGAPYRRAARPAGATALTATDEQAVPETPDTSGSGFGSGLGGVLSIGPGLGRRAAEGPRADPSDVLPVGAGYGATGAQVMVDPTPGRPSVAQRTAGPDGAAGADGTGGTDTEGSQRAKDQRQD